MSLDIVNYVMRLFLAFFGFIVGGFSGGGGVVSKCTTEFLTSMRSEDFLEPRGTGLLILRGKNFDDVALF